MVRTSKDRDPAVLEAIATLIKHPNYAVLVEEIEAAREKYFANFARGLASSAQPIDQREVDEKRGFWKGAIWALNTFPKLTSNRWDQFVEAALKEDESPE